MAKPKLLHVALTVADRAVSQAFYARYFGLDAVVHEDDHLLILSDGRGGLLAMSEGDVPPEAPPGTHFGFAMPARSDVAEMRARFIAEGVPEAQWQDDVAITRVQVFDPDRYRVEAYAWK